MVVMIGVDVVYIYAVLYGDLAGVIVAQVATAAVKVLWNDSFLWYCVPLLKQWSRRQPAQSKKDNDKADIKDERTDSGDGFEHSSSTFRADLLISHLNNSEQRGSGHGASGRSDFTQSYGHDYHGDVRADEEESRETLAPTSQFSTRITITSRRTTFRLPATMQSQRALQPPVTQHNRDANDRIRDRDQRGSDSPVPPQPVQYADHPEAMQDDKLRWSSLYSSFLSQTEGFAQQFHSYSQETQRNEAMEFDHVDILFVTINILINTLAIPCLAIAMVSTSCFRNALVKASAVTDTYSISICRIFQANLIRLRINGLTCLYETTIEESSSYDPPFIYSYQCSSFIAINYLVVYVLMFLFAGWWRVVYLVVMKMKYWQRVGALSVGQPCFNGPVKSNHHRGRNALAWKLPTLSEMFAVLHEDRVFYRYLQPLNGESGNDSLCPLSEENGEMTWSWRQSWGIMMYSYFVPKRLRYNVDLFVSLLLYSSEQRTRDDRDAERHSNDSLANPVAVREFPIPHFEIIPMYRLIVRYISYLAIFLSFGIIFPPLAVAIALSFVVMTSAEYFLITSFISLPYDFVAAWRGSDRLHDEQAYQQLCFLLPILAYFRGKLTNELNHSLRYLRQSLHLIFPFLCLIQSYLVFDTIGDRYQWRVALPYSLLSLLLPLIAIPVVKLIAWHRRRRWRRRTAGDENRGNRQDENEEVAKKEVAAAERTTGMSPFQESLSLSFAGSEIEMRSTQASREGLGNMSTSSRSPSPVRRSTIGRTISTTASTALEPTAPQVLV